MLRYKLVLAALLTLGTAAAPAVADAALRLHNVPSASGPGCRQAVVGLATDAARVRPLVPRMFVFSRDVAGKAQLGFRVQACDRLSVDGGPARSVAWAELGVRILPPEGLPEVHVDPHVDGHDYYVLAFRTTDVTIARRLADLGLRPPGAPSLLARDVGIGIQRRGDSLLSALDPTVGDLLDGGTITAVERTDSSTVQTTGSMLLGFVARTTPTVHVHQWFVGDDCRLLRVKETKTSTVGALAAFTIEASPSTLLAQLAAPPGRALRATAPDTLVIADSTTTWSAAPAPGAALSAVYDALRRLQQGERVGC